MTEWRRRRACRWAVAALSLLASTVASAVCSPYAGRATINEVHETGRGGPGGALAFVEVKLLDTDIAPAVYGNWEVQVCESRRGNCTSRIPLSDFDASTSPWLVLEENGFDRRTIDIRGGMSVVLRDAVGQSIDFLSVGGETRNADRGCTFVYDTDFPAGSNTQTLRRTPDGTGPWGSAGPGNSGDTTQGDDNAGDRTTLPWLSAGNVETSAGAPATFVLTLASYGPST